MRESEVARRPRVGTSQVPRRPGRHLAVLAAVTFVVLALDQSAQARYDPIASGSTSLTFARSFSALLRANGVTVKATSGATYKAGVATFPVSGGKLEPADVVGSVEHEASSSSPPAATASP
jgi:hypothetical protein